MRTIVIVVLLIGLAAGGTLYYSKYVAAEQNSTYRTATVKRGDLLITIRATGTAEPQDVVDVGAQVQGRIIELGKDPRGDTDPRYKGKVIDYTTEVTKGCLLASIDDSVYTANRDQAKASLDRAKSRSASVGGKTSTVCRRVGACAEASRN